MATKTSKDVSSAVMTRMQELGSAWVFKRAIQDNATFNKAEDIKKDKDTFKQLEDIWEKIGKVKWSDEDDKEWLENFFEQHKALLPKIGNAKFTEFSRDGGPRPQYILPGSNTGETFMDWVTKYIGKNFSISQKDNWNPADIWLIQDEKKWKDKIKAAMKTPRRSKGTSEYQLKQFNAIFRALFRTKQIMGISLKKVSGTATFKPVNVTGKFFKVLETTEMNFVSAKCLLGTRGITKKEADKERGRYGFQTQDTQDTVITIEDPGITSGTKTTFKVQIKGNSSTGFSNLKFEPTQEGKSSARMGKATRELVIKLMDEYKIHKGPKGFWKEKWQDYPQKKDQGGKGSNKKDEFAGVYQKDRPGMFYGVKKDYFDMLTEMKGEVDFGGVEPIDAIMNLDETLGQVRNQPWVANSKLQQLSWLYAFLQLNKKDRDAFCTDLIFLASKEGKAYGPFGKIY